MINLETCESPISDCFLYRRSCDTEITTSELIEFISCDWSCFIFMEHVCQVIMQFLESIKLASKALITLTEIGSVFKPIQTDIF